MDHKALTSRIKHRFRAGTYLRNIVVLMFGTSLAQMITLAAMPVLTRLFDPAAFGVLGIYLAISTPLAAVATLGYDQTVPLPKRESEALNVLLLGCIVTVAFALATLAGTVLFMDRIAEITGIEDNTLVILLIPVSVLANGWINCFAYWFTRQQQFGTLSRVNVGRSAATAVGQIGLGLVKGTPANLVTGRLSATALVTLIQAWYIYAKERRRIRRLGGAAPMWRLAKHYSEFPVYQAPMRLLNVFNNQMPALFFGVFFSPTVVGLYWFTARLLQTPRNLIGNSVRRVFYQRATQLSHQGKKIFPLFVKTSAALFALALPAAAIVFWFGPALFALVFGAEWREAGEYARWLMIAWVFSFANVPAVMLVSVHRIQGRLLVVEIGSLVIRGGAIYAGSVAGDPLYALQLFALSGMIVDATKIAYVGYYTWKREAAKQVIALGPSAGGEE